LPGFPSGLLPLAASRSGVTSPVDPLECRHRAGVKRRHTAHASTAASMDTRGGSHGWSMGATGLVRVAPAPMEPGSTVKGLCGTGRGRTARVGTGRGGTGPAARGGRLGPPLGLCLAHGFTTCLAAHWDLAIALAAPCWAFFAAITSSWRTTAVSAARKSTSPKAASRAADGQPLHHRRLPSHHERR
jgi:hypothetical protein